MIGVFVTIIKVSFVCVLIDLILFILCIILAFSDIYQQMHIIGLQSVQKF